jgi:hypothetical protein
MQLNLENALICVPFIILYIIPFMKLNVRRPYGPVSRI